MSHTLIVLPDDTAKPILDAFNGARKALNIRMFLFTDETLLGAVVAAKRRGVKVRVMLNPARRSGETENEESRAALIDAGVDVHTLKHLKLHAKMMLADSKRAIVGSINLAPGSFDSRRELAIETDHRHAVKRLEETALADWEASHRIDLSDEGLLADLKKRDLDASELAIGGADDRGNKKHKSKD